VRDFEAISIVGGGAITLCVAWALSSGILPSPLAHPNERSLHDRPVPRTGGIAIWAGASLTWVVAGAPAWWLAPLGAVLGISLLDDWRGVPARLRLLVHGGAALAAAIAYRDAGNPLGWPLAIFEAVAITWVANLYNFMDGSDGLAAGTGVLGFGAYAIAAAQGGADELAIQCATVAGACAAFLVFNRPPARLFMGDIGSVGLGFAAGLIGLHGFASGIWDFWLPPLVFAPFIADATITLLRRLRRGERLAQAHRDHFYQRKILVDGSHSGTLRAYLGWSLLCGLAALAAARWRAEAGTLVMLAAFLAFGGYCRAIDRRWAAHLRATHAA
jgi:UDP-N-acetylmuramyl pentapeptide phosphotransferase/UDP-N-acetylglucosamine-1-phosphate transferase